LIEQCKPVKRKLDLLPRYDAVNCEIDFGNVFFRMQGVFEDDNLDSDTIPLQINEEVHSWEPGKLQKARNRGTAVWNFKSIDISNAGHKDDQLHEAFKNGTAQHWEVKCPGCGRYHAMRARWDDRAPELGGLRYDSTGCKLEDGRYDYKKLAPTIRYQMPCGYTVREDTTARRSLSLSGRYGNATNTGATVEHKSFTLEAVSVDYIPWLSLIKQKHRAHKAWKDGDMKPWQVYLKERECRFVDPAERPMAKPLEVVATIKKDRAGMPNRLFRFAELDFQEGEGSELPHWWLLIADVDKDCNVLVVYEGKCEGDSEAVDVIRRHDVRPICVVVDSSYKAKQRIYDFCLRHGFNALKVEGGRDREYKHEDGSVHCWSPPEPLWQRAGRGEPTRENELEEPEFWLVADQGAQDLLNHIRAGEGRKFDLPSDISEDFKKHFSCWSLEAHKVPMTNEVKMIWKKSKDSAPDHLYKASTYLAVQCEMAELLVVNDGGEQTTTEEQKASVQ
jgi:hypothetical protein